MMILLQKQLLDPQWMRILPSHDKDNEIRISNKFYLFIRTKLLLKD